MRIIKFKYPALLAVTILLVASSCQKVVDLKFSNAAAQLVIEGNVTNMRGPQTVTISQTVPFTNTNTFPPVSGATVTISDGRGNVYKLIEGTTTPGTYTTSAFTGRTGLTYTLTVLADGKTYTGTSTMPAPVGFDPLSYADDTFDTNSKLVTVNFRDPIITSNQYRFVMYVNNTQVKDIFVSNDDFTDGGYVNIDLYQSDVKIKVGDAITVDEQCIDKSIYTYWFSLSQQQDNGAGGGTTPSNPPSNLSNDVLGYFSAHTTQKQSIVIK
jgi:hypothetical protein